jgi:SAM-dependent methyltransferase
VAQGVVTFLADSMPRPSGQSALRTSQIKPGLAVSLGASMTMYDENAAASYDDWDGSRDTSAEVSFLRQYTNASSRCLELAVGTGRVALELAPFVAQMVGVDNSIHMLQRLQQKDAQQRVRSYLDDMTSLSTLPGRFDLVYLTYNSFGLLIDQDSQVSCMSKVGELLNPAGVFVLETVIPSFAEWAGYRRVNVEDFPDRRARITISTIDPVLQRTTGQVWHIENGFARAFPAHGRYVWPSEILLMARLSGLTVAHRRGGWRGEPLTSDSAWCITVLTKPTTTA